MNIFSILSLVFLIVGGIAIIVGVKTLNPMMLAQGAILWIGTLFFEMIVMKDQIK